MHPSVMLLLAYKVPGNDEHLSHLLQPMHLLLIPQAMRSSITQQQLPSLRPNKTGEEVLPSYSPSICRVLAKAVKGGGPPSYS